MVEALACKADLSGFESHRYLQSFKSSKELNFLVGRYGSNTVRAFERDEIIALLNR